MPHAMSQMGVLLGTIIILWSALTSAFGLYLQSRCARYLERGSSSFFALSQLTYPNAAVIFDAAIAIKCFGVGVSYMIIIGDLMPGVMRGFSANADAYPYLVDRHFWITAFMLVIIPLSFLKRLDSLKYTSVIALISIGYLIVLVIYHFASDSIAERGEVNVIHWNGPVAFLSSLPVVVFAYTCHQNVCNFSSYSQLCVFGHWLTTSRCSLSLTKSRTTHPVALSVSFLLVLGLRPASTSSSLLRATLLLAAMSWATLSACTRLLLPQLLAKRL